MNDDLVVKLGFSRTTNTSRKQLNIYSMLVERLIFSLIINNRIGDGLAGSLNNKSQFIVFMAGGLDFKTT